MATTSLDPELDQSAQRVALFTMLIHAWDVSNFHEAARSADELEQLGIRVCIQRSRLSNRDRKQEGDGG